MDTIIHHYTNIDVLALMLKNKDDQGMVPITFLSPLVQLVNHSVGHACYTG